MIHIIAFLILAAVTALAAPDFKSDSALKRYAGDYPVLSGALKVAAEKNALEMDGEVAAYNQFASQKAGYGEFDCPRYASNPTSVHRLAPQDIKVVAALGDSLTAANGALASSAIGLLIQYRGVAWSIGGDSQLEDVATLPNILKKFNPDLYGYSVRTGQTGSGTAKLNVAKPGAKSKDMLGQARTLVSKLRSDSSINYQNDWKVITLFIGGNDLCDYCKDENQYSPGTYLSNVREALDHLHTNVPKAFVNLVTTVNVTFMKELKQGILCGILNQFECQCAAYPKNDAALAKLDRVVSEYTTVLDQLASSGRYDTRDDFTVVAQPFFKDTKPPRMIKNGKSVPDMSYFAPDCFHFSGKAHAAAALALWNNMVEPVGRKRTEWRVGERAECLNQDHPYFYTYKN